MKETVKFKYTFKLSNGKKIIVRVSTRVPQNAWCCSEYINNQWVITFGTRLQFANQDFIKRKIVHELSHVYWENWIKDFNSNDIVNEQYGTLEEVQSELVATFNESSSTLIEQDSVRIYGIIKEFVTP